MCGIAGIWRFKDVLLKDTLVQFTDSMSHRGPDGTGYELLHQDTLGLGHRRLSILDLSEAGKQPMNYANGRFWMVFNGEVFNFLSLRAELTAKGYQFQSSTDSEVVLAAYQEWGSACLHRFNGMWALAIWDVEKQSLFLARDRFGIKPLYYHFDQHLGFSFASETRSFKFLEGFTRSISEDLLDLTHQNNYALEGLGYTIFKDIYQLLPGHYMSIRKGDAMIQQRRWWSIEDRKVEVPKRDEERIESFHDLLEDSCKLRLQSDVPLATALSGGLDSTSVYSTVSNLLQQGGLDRVNKNSQSAFTAVFPGLKNDETEYAEEAAAYCNQAIHKISIPQNDLPERILRDTELADYIGNPISSITAVYSGMKEAGISVSMDGHGVDEMLYGYRDMVYGLYNNALYNQTGKAGIYRDVLLPMFHPSDRSRLQSRFDQDMQIHGSTINRVKRILKKTVGGIAFGTNEFVPAILPSLSDKPYNFNSYPYEERMLYFEFFQNTLPALLRNFDRAGMMSSVEIRMPFMDYRLVEYIFSLPASAKIGEGFTKLILRNAMKGKIPESLRTRTFKVGIMSPTEYWFNKHLKEFALDLVTGNTKRDLEKGYQEGSLGNRVISNAWKEMNLKIIEG